MTGAEHYVEAERKLLMAREDDRDGEESAWLIAEAQVHATLAHAAATALGDGVLNYNAWSAVAGVRTSKEVSA